MPSENVKKMIENVLRKNHCRIKEQNGIWYVRAANGKVWDFTVPQLSTNKDINASTFFGDEVEEFYG